MKKTSCFLVVLLVIEVAGISLLRYYDSFYKTVPVKDFDALQYHYPSETPKEFKQFAGNSPVAIMRNVMNFVDGKNKALQLKSERIKDFYDHAKKGGEFTCNGMSELFLHALRLQGYRARKLFVVKSIGDPAATHTLVEVFENNKWVIYDPTFNVSFERDGQLLGATDIARSLVDGSFKSIRPVFYGEVAYPARLQTYPIYWLAHFNNILLFQHGDSSSWFVRNTIQLPLRYWQGPILYYFSPSSSANNYLELLNWFYFFFTCIGPSLLLILSLILFLSFCIHFVRKIK